MSVKAPAGTSTPPRPTAKRPHLADLVLSLIDARISHVELMDTDWEAELERYYRARRASRRAARAGTR